MIIEYVLRAELKGKHVYVHVFCGKENQTKALLGKLVMDIGEYQGLVVLLKIGAAEWGKGDLYKITCKGYLKDEEVE